MRLCELKRSLSAKEDVEFLIHLWSHLLVIFMRQVAFLWFDECGTDAPTYFSQIMVEEGLNLVIEEVI